MSGWSKINPIGTRSRATASKNRFLGCIAAERSKKYASDKMKRILQNSADCIPSPPIPSQLRAPFTFLPNSNVMTKSAIIKA